MKIASLTLAVLATAGIGAAQAQSQGVSKTEIVIGTIQDLSGPIAAFGKQSRNGMQLRVDEINEQGGIAGRKLKLLVEDAGYDPKRAVLAAQKLVNQDKIFLMAGHIGTAHNNAAMPVQFEKNVINFLPITAAREMYEPFHKLKYSFAATYYDQIRTTLPKLVKDKAAKKVCTTDDVLKLLERNNDDMMRKFATMLAAQPHQAPAQQVHTPPMTHTRDLDRWRETLAWMLPRGSGRSGSRSCCDDGSGLRSYRPLKIRNFCQTEIQHERRFRRIV